MKHIIFLGLMVIAVNGFSNEVNKAYVFGVFPHLPKHKLYKMYSQVATNFSEKLNRAVRIKTKSSFSAFEDALQSQEFDFALIQPFDYPDAHDKYNYFPLARRSNNLATILIVKKESKYNSLKDLKNKIIANPAKSAAVSHLTDRTIKKHGFDPQKDFTRVYKNNHFSCMQSVLVGSSDACGTSYRALLHYEDTKMKNRFRVINTSEEIPHILYVVHKRVRKKDRDILLNTILNWRNTPEGRRILKISRMINFKAAIDSDYDVLRN